MLKDLKKIYKAFKAGNKLGNKHDVEPLDVPVSPLSLPEETNQSETSKLQNNRQYRDSDPLSIIQQDNASLAANHFSQAAKEKTKKPTPFFKRLYSALYLETLFLVLVQMNAANAENEHQDASNVATQPIDANTSEELTSSTNINWSQGAISLKSVALKIDDFVDAQSNLGISTEAPSKDIRLDRLLDDLVTHNNFTPMKLKELDKSKTVSLQKFSKENEFDIVDEENDILIELDDDALLFATEELAVFGGNGFNFFIVNNEALNLFENNTLDNSWGSLRPGQEYFILKKEDVLEDDIEVVSLDEEISFDDEGESQTTETITVHYFMFQETIIGMSFDLPPDFYEKHGDIDIASLFT
ncbi:hypothetical protein WH96_16995 [Kiloniella spongiae]|uniref:Uncharacterized protein n=1 Tax=Kiloniella spongiae TaxID=1489064 RepID=A0A0H2MSF0_9PROT|nr:hypothetical protein [Kiloniella spongiae]KLN59565.1 hypothetical protein WH96_16995 [Kiloniella spongiae]